MDVGQGELQFCAEVIGVSINKIKLYTVLVSAVAVLSIVCVLISPATVTLVYYMLCVVC